MNLRRSEVDKIVSRLLEHKFGEAFKKLKEREVKLAERVYNDVFSAAHRKLMAELPEGWLPARSHIVARFGGSQGRLDHGTPLRVPNSKSDSWGTLKVYEATHALAEAYQELENDKATLKAERTRLSQEATGAITTARTMKRLLETWPEIEPFTRGLAKPVSLLPAIPIQTLNSSFGLPVKGRLPAAVMAAPGGGGIGS